MDFSDVVIRHRRRFRRRRHFRCRCCRRSRRQVIEQTRNKKAGNQDIGQKRQIRKANSELRTREIWMLFMIAFSFLI